MASFQMALVWFGSEKQIQHFKRKMVFQHFCSHEKKNEEL
jgi:hypothetical protein